MMTTYEGRRITPDEVEAAYRETGLTPAHGDWFSKKGTCGCAVAAIAMARGVAVRTASGKPSLPNNIAKAAGMLGYTFDYLAGFLNGFEGALGNHIPDNAERLTAVLDGLGCAAKVFGYGTDVELDGDETRVLLSAIHWGKYWAPHGNYLRPDPRDTAFVRRLIDLGLMFKCDPEHSGPNNYRATTAGVWVGMHRHPLASRLFRESHQ